MAVVYNATLKNTRMDSVDTAVNAGAAAGKLEIGPSGFASILATIDLADPAFGASAAGVITLAGVPRSDTSADNTGTAAEARIRDSDNNDIVTGLTVTLSGGGGDIILDSLSITAGQTVTISTGTITHG